MSRLTCHVSLNFLLVLVFFDNLVELVDEGLLSTGLVKTDPPRTNSTPLQIPKHYIAVVAFQRFSGRARTTNLISYYSALSRRGPDAQSILNIS